MPIKAASEKQVTCGQDEPASSAPLWGKAGEINEPQTSHREGAWLYHFRAEMLNGNRQEVRLRWRFGFRNTW